jgi:phosphopantothenoylcysteine decarboxylase / phosphopantothenate---cysteine ligase
LSSAKLSSAKLSSAKLSSAKLSSGDLSSAKLSSGDLSSGDLDGVSVVVSAGGTREALDPVRFIGNRSSGKQGYAIAEAALRRGATVTLVSTTDRPVPAGAELVAVESAAQMHEAMQALGDADVIVMAAAVADFRPVESADRKIKKHDGLPQVTLEATPDILAGLGARKPPGQILIGFAAETNDVVANAVAKLKAKNVDAIVANDVSAPQVGFAHDTNEVTILTADGSSQTVSLRSKAEIAEAVLDTVIDLRSR